MNFQTPLARLRLIGLIEGTSCWLLFFVAMPLKYLADTPEAVRVVGTLHGGFWVLYMLALTNVWITRRWPFSRVLLFGVGSIPPLMTLLLDSTLRKEQAALRQDERTTLTVRQARATLPAERSTPPHG